VKQKEKKTWNVHMSFSLVIFIHIQNFYLICIIFCGVFLWSWLILRFTVSCEFSNVTSRLWLSYWYIKIPKKYLIKKFWGRFISCEHIKFYVA
jgi:hypothetical protein